jgi:poly(A) polymerase
MLGSAMPDRIVPVDVSPDVDDLIEAVREAAARHHVETYLVGGFVRDRLRGALAKDLDLVTVSSDGVTLLADVAQRFGWARPQQFERFGTAQIRGDGFIVEVVRARAERYDPESRKPDVQPGTLEQDVERRDFTVNALCQTLEGRILDITGRGLVDLRAGVLRTPQDPRETFAEDPLRMFRAARFVAQLGFTLADGTEAAMRSQAARVEILSVERVSEELRRLLVAPHPRAGIRVLHRGGLLEHVLPELMAMIGVEQGGFHTHDVYEHTLQALDRTPRDLLTRTATLLHDVGKPPTHAIAEDGRHTFYNHASVGADMARDILTRLRFSNDEIESVALLVQLHLRPIQYNREAFSDAAVRRLIVAAGEQRERMLDLARADTAASAFPTTAGIDELAARMAALDAGAQVSRMADPLDGTEIMAIANRPPGRWVGRVKAAIREAMLDGTIALDDADAARRFLSAHPELLSSD